ncbi:MAG TPA: FAD-dependent oxidoreductase [Thermoleophilaceae bacterium]|nr:FAD-dependent oxidoreductase [Thermoleophilaceae bacterium]
MDRAAVRRSFADAEPRPFWLSQPDAPSPGEPLQDDLEADLVVIGGGLTGLWAALLAKEQDPRRDVVLLEGERVAFGATGRNGGFVDASLTHGLDNGASRWPDEMPQLERLARENFAAIKEAIRRHGIGAGFEETGELSLATRPHQAEWIPELVETARKYGWPAEAWSAERAREEVHSPTYHGAAYLPEGRAIVDPARLAWGLAQAARESGVHVYERSPVTGLKRGGEGIEAATHAGRVRAGRAVLATSAFPPLVSSIRRYVVPVYDYVLVTEPLPADRRHALGWQRRQGLTDLGNLFHYYRLTSDDRVLWGGYDAVYNFRNGMGPHLDERPATFELLATHFFETFPQLEGVRFSHRWGGAIDTCSRFSVMFGRALEGRAVYAVGYTGLGVAASRFGAQVALDLADGRDTERTRLEMVRSKPVPFPPEPLRWAGIALTRRALAKSDRRGGRRGPWLRTLDRLGMGFDS